MWLTREGIYDSYFIYPHSVQIRPHRSILALATPLTGLMLLARIPGGQAETFDATCILVIETAFTGGHPPSY